MLLKAKTQIKLAFKSFSYFHIDFSYCYKFSWGQYNICIIIEKNTRETTKMLLEPKIIIIIIIIFFWTN
jgi:hypothetical protein